ncbi:MAG: hypothetical protein R6U78_03780 [Bacteroidales bacterium]
MLFATLLTISSFTFLAAQEEISWLDDFTGEVEIRNDTYQYRFTTVEGNDCKVNFEEQVTDRRGSVEMRSWVFYLSDIDPEALRFKTRGRSIEVTLETENSREFISYYEEGEFEEYTDEIEITMNEVDMTRAFIETLREHIGSCMEAEVKWDDREAAFDWLSENIGKATEDDLQWEQSFSREDKPYMAGLEATSVDEDGEKETFQYLFDLTDINPLAIGLEVSGRSLAVEVPVKGGEDYIQVDGTDGREYTDELKIYADDIEVARQIVNALSYLVTNTTVERPQWSSYQEALGFVKDHLGEVTIDDEVFHNSLNFEEDPSGLLELTVKETESDGETEQTTYAFYLADMTDKPVLDVSRDEITIEMETRDDVDFIREVTGEDELDYTSDLEFHAAEIDVARDLVNAFAYATGQSEEKIREFSTVAEVNGWMIQNLVPLFRKGERYEQMLLVDEDAGNRIEFDLKLTEEDGEITETRYLIYPEDISLEELEIDISWGRMTVPLETEDDYIRTYVNGEVEDFTDEAEVYFSDPMVAKNFMAAIRFLKEQVTEQEPSAMSREEALSFLEANIPDIQLPGEKHEQKLEILEGDDCKLKFTRVETDDDGESDEYMYEFMVADIHDGNSEISVDGMLVEVILRTAGDAELIKPYENGEVEDFEDEFTIYADDVRLVRLILSAFGDLSEACR